MVLSTNATNYIKHLSMINKIVTNYGLSLIELLVTVTIIVTVAGFGIARFRDFGTTKDFDRVVDELLVNIDSARNLAMSQNSANCGTSERLSSITFAQTGANTYEIFIACEGNYRFGTPSPSPSLSFTPRRQTTMGAGVLFFGGPSTLATFFSDGTASAGSNLPLYSTSTNSCTCVRVLASGTIQKTLPGSCTFTASPLNVTCGTSWD
jgi:prepilin-type N-terminal cleavage/methylation domain-containing protein